MRINVTYRSLLDKSVSCLLSAIEVYNKPNFEYREETFSILAVNAWELLLKAKLLKENRYKIRSLYVLQPAITKSGKPHKTKKEPKLSRSKNPLTHSIEETIRCLEQKRIKLPKGLKGNIESLIELRDNAIHFTNLDDISKQAQELGFACIKNYISIIREWDLEIELSKYNLYLMPLAYVDNKAVIDGITTDESKRYIDFVKTKICELSEEDSDYDIAVKIDVKFEKGNSFEGIGFRYDPNGFPITLTEVDIKSRFPLTYSDIRNSCRNRYTDFKQDKAFYDIMKNVKMNPKLYYERRLDPDNPKSNKKPFYSSNIFKELDKYYTKKKV